MAGKRLNESSIPAKYTAPNEVIYAIVLCHIIEIEKSLHWNIVNSWKLDKQGPEGPLSVYWKQSTPKTPDILILAGTHD